MVLQSIRERLTGVLAFVILGILIIPFAFVGVNEYFSSGNANQVAMVNDQEITFNDFNQSFLNYRRVMQSRLGENFDPADFDSLVARLEHLDRMIDEELLRQAALEQGYGIDNERLAETIRSLPAFQVGGEFNADVYQARLMSQGMNVAQFENQMRESSAVSTLPQAIRTSSFATDREYKEFIGLQEQTRSFEVLKVPADLEAAPTEFSEEEIQAAYTANQDQYQTEEMVTIEFLELTLQNIDVGEPPSEDQLRATFEAQESRFITPERRRVSHILLEVGPDADDATREAARIEAEVLVDRARSGEDFAALASEASDDIGSAALGGDLGFLEPGIMAESFEDAAYALSLDEPVSDPVQTGFGWHVILLTEVREASGMSFEEARELLLEEAREDVAEQAYLDLADRMVDVIYEDPTTLEAASLDLGIEIQTEGPFTRAGGINVSANPDVVEAAFSDLVLLQGSVSDPIDLGLNHMIMLRVLEHQPVRAQTLDEVRDDVVAQLRQEAANGVARAQADNLLAEVESGKTLAEISAESGLELITAEAVGRQAFSPDPVTVSNIFRMPRPEDGETIRQVVEADDGFSLVVLSAVTDGTVDENELLSVRQARTMMASVNSSYESWALVRQLREQADVQIFEDNLGVSR